ncbi:hypothetical protein J1782_24890 [Rahnella sp. BCC 1045]|uniref:hypothetical protein n=1 Tax=Rahnella sp. BCC 1045 TaxID=2816251 RepID=UPI001C253023|nr:hypothetical protein [Rahnella sp. BCC 1045]MBU9823132.1 hypothetical protein [Rahnella sp. BCC 1045]
MMKQLSIEELKKMRKHSASLCHDSYVSALDELIAIRELKGDQVPVAWVSASDARAISQYSNKNNLCYESCLWFMKRFDSDVPLFTAPQKPVVLPSKISMGFKQLAEIYDCEPAQAQFIAVGWNAAIKAAGGIVKDGE